jgi:pimeloyl-ACP methyl ester carboxylesterase
MSSQFSPLKLLTVAILFVAVAGVGNAVAQSPLTRRDPALATLGKGFVSGTARVNGTTLHYVRGGTGPAVTLVHGFPQDWFAFHKIMPRLAKKFTVIAFDLRGVGRSTMTAEPYEATILAQDIYELASKLNLKPVYVVGHDNGGIVAYTFMRLYPNATRGVMILDVPLPGIEPWKEVKANPVLWHFAFHQTPKLPEKMIAGRQYDYFREFFDRFALKREAIPDADVRHYVRAYASPQQLRAGIEFYRTAYPASEEFNSTHRAMTDVPVVLAGGDHATAPLYSRMVNSLKEHGCTRVTVEVINNSGHWVVDEQPAAVAELIERYATTVEGQKGYK